MDRKRQAVWAGMAAALALFGSNVIAESYLGISAGQARVDAEARTIEAAFAQDDDFTVSATRIDDTDTGWKTFVGYRFSEALAIEGGFVDLGRAEFRTTVTDAPFPVSALTPFDIRATADAQAVNLVGLLQLPLADTFFLFIKAGAFAWQSDFQERIEQAGITRVAISDEGTDLTYGAGAAVRLGRGVRLRVEWERFENVGEGIGGREGADVDLASAGLTIDF